MLPWRVTRWRIMWLVKAGRGSPALPIEGAALGGWASFVVVAGVVGVLEGLVGHFDGGLQCAEHTVAG